MKPIINKELYNELVIYSVQDENKSVKKNSTLIEIYTRVQDFDTKDHKKALDFIKKAQSLFTLGNASKDLSQKELYILHSDDYNPHYRIACEYLNYENYFKITVGASTFKKSVIKEDILFSNIFEKLLTLVEKGYYTEDVLEATKQQFVSHFEKNKNTPNYHLSKALFEKADDFLSKIIYGTTLNDDFSYFNNEEIEFFSNKLLKVLLNPVDAFGFAYIYSDDSDYIVDATKTVKETFKGVQFIKPIIFDKGSSYLEEDNQIIEVDSISNSLLITRTYFKNKISNSPVNTFINDIYGAGMGSWLFTEIREKLEAGYSTFGAISLNNNFIYTSSGILNEKYEAVTKKINELNKDLINGKFDKEMLESSKAAKINEVDRLFNSEFGLKIILETMYWFNANTIEELKELYNKVIVEDLTKITSTLNPELISCFIKGTKNE